MKFERSNKYDKTFLKENMMGPNCLKLLEEILEQTEPEAGMRVLDLGCGKGLTSLFLAKEYGATVFATDLWISATENYELFSELSVEDKIIPIHADALSLPFAQRFFDIAVSVDAYQYFGTDPEYMDKHLAPLVKKGGAIAIAAAGAKKETDSVPTALAPYISEQDYEVFHSCKWWESLLSQSEKFELEHVWELEGADEAWADWLETDNPYAVRDRDMIKDAGHHLSLIGIVGKSK